MFGKKKRREEQKLRKKKNLITKSALDLLSGVVMGKPLRYGQFGQRTEVHVQFVMVFVHCWELCR